MWLVLLNLKTRRVANQRELADAVGIRDHAHAPPQRDGSRRPPHPAARSGQPAHPHRRAHRGGEAAFLRLRDAALAFDQRLRAGIGDAELVGFESLLDRLAANATADATAA